MTYKENEYLEVLQKYADKSEQLPDIKRLNDKTFTKLPDIDEELVVAAYEYYDLCGSLYMGSFFWHSAKGYRYASEWHEFIPAFDNAHPNRITPDELLQIASKLMVKHQSIFLPAIRKKLKEMRGPVKRKGPQLPAEPQVNKFELTVIKQILPQIKIVPSSYIKTLLYSEAWALSEDWELKEEYLDLLIAKTGITKAVAKIFKDVMSSILPAKYNVYYLHEVAAILKKHGIPAPGHLDIFYASDNLIIPGCYVSPLSPNNWQQERNLTQFLYTYIATLLEPDEFPGLRERMEELIAEHAIIQETINNYKASITRVLGILK